MKETTQVIRQGRQINFRCASPLFKPKPAAAAHSAECCCCCCSNSVQFTEFLLPSLSCREKRPIRAFVFKGTKNVTHNSLLARGEARREGPERIEHTVHQTLKCHCSTIVLFVVCDCCCCCFLLRTSPTHFASTSVMNRWPSCNVLFTSCAM